MSWLLCLWMLSSQTDAQAILEQASQRQGGRKLGDELTSIQAKVIAYVYRYENGRKQRNTVEAEYVYSDGKILSTLIEEVSSTRSTDAFDGKSYWHEAKGQVTRLDGVDFREDREAIRNDIHMMRVLSQVFLIHKTAEELRELTRLGDDSGHGLESHVVEGLTDVAFGDEKKSYRMRIWVQKETYRILGVRLTDLDGKEPVRTLCFWDFERDENGVEAPRTLKIFQGPPGDDMLEAELIIHDLTLNEAIPADRFKLG